MCGRPLLRSKIVRDSCGSFGVSNAEDVGSGCIRSYSSRTYTNDDRVGGVSRPHFKLLLSNVNGCGAAYELLPDPLKKPPLPACTPAECTTAFDERQVPPALEWPEVIKDGSLSHQVLHAAIW